MDGDTIKSLEPGHYTITWKDGGGKTFMTVVDRIIAPKFLARIEKVEPAVWTKPIHISFNVPAGLDTPSEVLAAAKELIVEALRQHAENEQYDFTDDQRALMAALLMES